MQITRTQQIACALALIAVTVEEYPETGPEVTNLFHRMLKFTDLHNHMTPEEVLSFVESIVTNLET